MGPAFRLLSRVVAVRPEEFRALLGSFAYFFCLLAGYYVLRPLRDEMGIAGGVKNLQWMFTATFLAMLAAVPAFGALVARLPRSRFIPLVYHFFVANIAVFWVLLTLDYERAIVARVFFVWISVFNLFAVSVFWSFMADLWTSEQGKRLFGFIAACGTAGPAITVLLAKQIGPANLLIIAAVFLELAVLCATRIFTSPSTKPQESIGGGWWAGFLLLLRSPYLAGIALWVFLLSLAGTFLYFQQANIVAAASADPAERTRIFATIDLAIGILQLAVQLVATGRLIERFGVGRAAAFLPLVFAIGFVVLAWSPALAVVIAFQAIQRTANFAISNPSFQLFFTVLDREEKYKAKNVIDIVVFRGADAVTGWLFSALRGAGLELATISIATVPVCIAWLVLALALGRAQEGRARANMAE